MTRWKPPKVIDRPDPCKVLDQPRPCSVCKQPTIFTTQRGRAVHPTCEPARDHPTPELVRRQFAEVAAIVHPRGIWPEPPAPPYVPGPTPTVLPPSPYPCAACGTTQDVSRWLPADVWRCWIHTPFELPVQSWEIRGFPPIAPTLPVFQSEETTREHVIA